MTQVIERCSTMTTRNKALLNNDALRYFMSSWGESPVLPIHGRLVEHNEHQRLLPLIKRPNNDFYQVVPKQNA
jgi:hypothetical protein